MNQSVFKIVAIALLFFTACDSQQALMIKNADSAARCTAKGGYWYQQICWANYEDEGIAKTDIDRVVDEQMVAIENAKITVNNQAYPISFFIPFPEGKDIMFLTIFNDGEGTKSLIQQVPMKKLQGKGIFESEATLIPGNIMRTDETSSSTVEEDQYTGLMQVQMIDEESMEVRFEGQLGNSNGTNTYKIEMQTNEALGGAGNSTMVVKGTEVHINGDLGTKSYHQLRTILKEHPEVKTAVLGQISGSVNDAVNMHTGRILHEAGLNTKVLADSEIASGGVDLFCAGVERIVEKGAKIGIHSWCCLDDLTAIEIPQDHPAHRYQIDYFTMCMGKENGPAFYFHTLRAAPFDDIHWMSTAEIENWKVATQFLDK